MAKLLGKNDVHTRWGVAFGETEGTAIELRTQPRRRRAADEQDRLQQRREIPWDVAEGLVSILQDGSTSYVTRSGRLPLEQINGTGMKGLRQACGALVHGSWFYR